MITLTNLTLSGNQTSPVTLADGSTATFTFYYRAAVRRWFFDVSYPAANFTDQGKGLATFPNLLRLWRNVLPFGLAVATADGTDPFLASDLAPTGTNFPPRVVVTVLDQTNGNTDVTDVETAFFAAGAASAY